MLNVDNSKWAPEVEVGCLRSTYRAICFFLLPFVMQGASNILPTLCHSGYPHWNKLATAQMLCAWQLWQA